MRTGVVYKLRVIGTKYFLYGSTIDLNKRVSDYLCQLRKNKYKNAFLQNVYNKHGEKKFRWEVVQKDIPEDILFNIENIWMGANCSRTEDNKGGMNINAAGGIHQKRILKIKIKMEKNFIIRGIPAPKCGTAKNFVSFEEAALYVNGNVDLIKNACDGIVEFVYCRSWKYLQP